jgi:hypothetical protein
VDELRLALGTRQRPWAHYGFSLVPAFVAVVLWLFRLHFIGEPPVTPMAVAIAGYAIALVLLGALVIHLTRGIVGLAIGTLVSWLGAVFVLGPALILIALNILH